MMEYAKIAAALVKAQTQFGTALKSSSNPHFKSKYADLAACVEAVIDGLNQNGIALIQKQHPHDGGVCVETVFVHESGEMLSAGLLTVPAAKQDPQGYGSALTYARRYSLMAACGIAPEDDDGNAASKKPAQRPPAIPAPTARDRELQELAAYMAEAHKAGRDLDAIRVWYDPKSFDADLPTANEERKFVWNELREFSKLRSTIKANRPEDVVKE